MIRWLTLLVLVSIVGCPASRDCECIPQYCECAQECGFPDGSPEATVTRLMCAPYVND